MAKRLIIPGEAATEAAEAAEAFDTYGGKTPPAGTYRCKVVKATYNEANRNGDPYITVRFNVDHEVDEPRARFNGYSRTGNLTINEAQAKYNKQFCEAVGITAKALHRVVIEDDGTTILKFGATDVTDLRARVSFKNGSYQGKRQLDPRSFMVDRPDDSDVRDADDDDESYEAEYTDDDAPDDTYTGEDEDGDYDDADLIPDDEDIAADAEAEEADDDDEYSDDEDEPEPVKAAPRKAVKAPPARPTVTRNAAAKKAPAKSARKPF